MSERKKAPSESGAQPQHPPVPSAGSDARTVRTQKTIWSALDEIWAEVPDEELAKLPTDLAVTWHAAVQAHTTASRLAVPLIRQRRCRE